MNNFFEHLPDLVLLVDPDGTVKDSAGGSAFGEGGANRPGGPGVCLANQFEDLRGSFPARTWRTLDLRSGDRVLEARLGPAGGDDTLVVLRDVTVQRRDDEQFRSDQQEMLYAASHDLSEPLRKVIAFGDRLKKQYAEVLDEKGLDYLARMQDAARRMGSLVDGLLSLSRVATQAEPFAPVDLEEVVRNVLVDLEVRIEETGARVTVEPLPAIEADPLQMRQLFQNLVGNALKFHREGTAPEVKVGTDETLGEGRCVIRVEDNGIGFDPQYADRIFKVFHRLHGRSEFEGAGIGLALCKRIVERHGGSLCAEGRPGEGAAFVVTLPERQQEGH